MSDNPEPSPDAFFALADHAVVELAGRDALVFAQAQTMNDVAALADGQWQWNGWLTPKGRLIALFAALRLDPQTLWLLLPDVDPAAIANGLQRFVFRSKVAIRLRDDLAVEGTFAAPAAARVAQSERLAEGAVELDFGATGGTRTLRVGESTAAPDPWQAARWRALDLRHGLPRLDVDQVEQWTPQQLSLDRLAAFSVKKGCYPGQEIVARTHFLGQAKRQLMLLEGEGDIAPGSVLALNGQGVGTIASRAGQLALAVAPPNDASQGWTSDGMPLVQHSLLDGLRR